MYIWFLLCHKQCTLMWSDSIPHTKYLCLYLVIDTMINLHHSLHVKYASKQVYHLKLIKFEPYCRVIMNNPTRLVNIGCDYLTVTFCTSFICWCGVWEVCFWHSAGDSWVCYTRWFWSHVNCSSLLALVIIKYTCTGL
jgi:hypothetical protein